MTKNPTSTGKFSCLECTKTFVGRMCDRRRGKAKFCSVSCSSAFKARKRNGGRHRFPFVGVDAYEFLLGDEHQPRIVREG